jgi:histidinol phosphatase-like PHP family hydrolase
MIRQDLHIHTHLSSCSDDPLQTPSNIYARAVELGLSQICLTDHFWDTTMAGASDWYKHQNLEHIRASLSDFPALKGDTEIFFGCETEYIGGEGIGISHDTAMKMDFVLIPISHFHMKGYVRPASITTADEVAELWMSRYQELLEVDLPWSRVGLAHVINCCVDELQTEFLRNILKRPLKDLFSRTADMGISIEINASSLFEGEAARMNREIYKLMKECGCSFTAGSDAHSQEKLKVINGAFEFAETIGLGESDFRILK